MSKNIIEIALKAGFINTSNGLESPFIEGEDLTDNLKLFASLLLAQPEQEQEAVAWKETIIELFQSVFDSEMLCTAEGEALIRLEDAICYVEELVIPTHEQPEQPNEPAGYSLAAELLHNKAWYQKGYSDAKQELKREPLSTKQAEDLWETTFKSAVPYYIFDEICVAIEQYHGIGTES